MIGNVHVEVLQRFFVTHSDTNLILDSEPLNNYCAHLVSDVI